MCVEKDGSFVGRIQWFHKKKYLKLQKKKIKIKIYKNGMETNRNLEVHSTPVVDLILDSKNLVRV